MPSIRPVHRLIRAANDNHDLGYTLHYWRTRDKKEIDFVLYGEPGLVAIEVKRAARFRADDLAGRGSRRSSGKVGKALFFRFR